MAGGYGRGFTLLELSIVLVIIGLLLGGILLGRDLIRVAELRKLHQQVEEFSVAVNVFKGKYHCLPGDCKNATEVFGLNADCPSSPGEFFISEVMTVATCNGDDDGKIDAIDTMFEGTTLWQQVAAAGLISGSYTGGFILSGDALVPGLNLPMVAGVSGRSMWFVGDGDTWTLAGSGSPALVPGHFGTILLAIAMSDVRVLTPTDMHALDMKFDDGSPVTGNILAANAMDGPVPYCTDAADETVQDSGNAGAQYLANDPTYKDRVGCGVLYVTQW